MYGDLYKEVPNPGEKAGTFCAMDAALFNLSANDQPCPVCIENKAKIITGSLMPGNIGLFGDEVVRAS